VVFFFVLSGFLITGILWDSKVSRHWLRNFYARRALRILPLYYAVLLVAASIMLARGARFTDLRSLGFYAVFLQNFPAGWYPPLSLLGAPPLYHLWSLAVEEQFYLVWPFLLMPCRSRRAAVWLCLGTFAASFAFRVAIFANPRLSADTALSFGELPITNVGALALGAALALAMRGGRDEVKLRLARIYRLALPAFLGGLMVYLASSYVCGTLLQYPRVQFVIGLPAVSVMAAAAIPLLLRPGLLRRFFSLAPLTTLGRISYGFYIFHLVLKPIIDTIGFRVAHTNGGSEYQLVRFIAGFPITLLLSYVSFQFLELPFLRRKRNFPEHAPLPPALDAV
jgi:peptidoglycan/LPS O-acetylase OafA/YrhL